MKVIKLFFTIAALGALVVVKASSFDKEFKLWKKSPAKSVEFDKEVKVSGSGSIKLTNKSTAIRTFDLKPGTAYELTFYVRGQDVEGSKGKGGRIMLFDGRKKWGRITTRINNVVEHGTFDWRQGKAVIKSSDWGDKIRVSLAMRGRGTLWFDEVEFKEVGKEEKISSFRKIYNSDYQSLALVPQGTLGFFEPQETCEKSSR